MLALCPFLPCFASPGASSRHLGCARPSIQPWSAHRRAVADAVDGDKVP